MTVWFLLFQPIESKRCGSNFANKTANISKEMVNTTPSSHSNCRSVSIICKTLELRPSKDYSI